MKVPMTRDKVATGKKTPNRVGKSLCLSLQDCAVHDGQSF